MAKRSDKRNAVKAEYVARLKQGENIVLKQFAEEMGISYQTLRNWKKQDEWEKEKPKRKRGAQPGNRNCRGHKNAAGSHEGAPIGNKNAEKDGAYSAVFFDMLTDAEKELAERTPRGSQENLYHELQILKVREHRVMERISFYEREPEDSLYVHSLMDMRVPAGKGSAKKDGAAQQMGMYNKDSAFARILKLQEALYKIQGRIATITNTLKSLEEYDTRLEIERKKLELLEMRATGAMEIADPEVVDESIHVEDSSAVAGTDREENPPAKRRRRDRRGKTGSVRPESNDSEVHNIPSRGRRGQSSDGKNEADS